MKLDHTQLMSLLDIDKLKASGEKPRLHGNGFIQLDLPQTRAGVKQRLHIWDTQLPKQRVSTQIHNHVFTFSSMVIQGRLINRRVQILPAGERGNPGTHFLYEAQPGEGQDTKLVPLLDGCVYADDIESRMHEASGPSSVYSMTSLDYHESISVAPRTATIMRKSIFKDPHVTLLMRPRVLVPLYATPDNDFNRHNAMTELDMWNFVHDVCDFIKGEGE